MERMKFFLMAIVAAMAGIVSSISIGDGNSPLGYWKTIDDVTGKPKSIIQIYQTADNKIAGRVVKIFPREGQTQNKLCTECKGDLHNQPIVGMTILSSLQQKQDSWRDGKIIDPESGKNYTCSLQLVDRGQKLNVHGYIGIPLLGRSQTWERVDLLARKEFSETVG